MKKILFSFSFLVFAILANAQTSDLLWAKNQGGMMVDEASSIVVQGTSNIYLTGKFSKTADFDPGLGVFNLTADTSVSIFNTDIFISKIDTSGNFIWAKKVGGPQNDYSTCITTDLAGNVYITGVFVGNVDFDPGAGVYNLTSSGAGSYTSAYILKLDSSGNFIWAKCFAGATSYGVGYAIAVDVAENVYTTGAFSRTVDFDPGPGTFNLTSDLSSGNNTMFVSKLDAFGNFVWAERFGGATGIDEAYGISLVLDISGNLYISGTFNYTIDFDPGPGTYSITSDSIAGGNSDMFILKLNSSGNLLWVKNIGKGGYDSAISITLDLSNNVCVAGGFQGTVDFDPGIGVYNLLSGGIFVLKLDQLGNFILAKRLGSSGIRSIMTDASRNIYAIGDFGGVNDFDPSAGTYYLTCAGVADIYISKFDSLGNFIWVKGMGSSGFDSGSSFALDSMGNIYAVGEFFGVVDFDSGIGTSNLASFGSRDIFILKLGKTMVWPGDSDKNNIVDNNDLLPIGIYYGQTGTPRATISNTWQAYNSTDWGILQPSGADIKHVDCNGDGTIDNNDTLAINLNFALTHAFAPSSNELRLLAPDLHFVTSSSSYLSGSMVDVQVWLGNSTTPVSNLYGIAFDINYDASLVQPSSESLTYPTSWLGTPGTDAITISKVDALGNTAYGAETRINQVNASGFGKIADFKFQLKSSIPANTVMYFSTLVYQANDASGTPVLFNTPLDSIVINPTSVAVSEINNGIQISVFPNPSNGSFNIFTSEQIKNGSIEIYNAIGELIFSQKIINQQNAIDLKNQSDGLYFVKVISDGEVIGMKKIVKE